MLCFCPTQTAVYFYTEQTPDHSSRHIVCEGCAHVQQASWVSLWRSSVWFDYQDASVLLEQFPPSRGQEAHFDWQDGYSLSISAREVTLAD